ncbi:MAG: hypothetical protein GTN74_01490 [Proteobacteria bacterium]|nr:hypothetical protein [Pseudomonadota bacterium]NIS67785.1 hypothetical protein [Pseudomonadota bacterium]
MEPRHEKLRLDRFRRIIRAVPLEGPPIFRWIKRAPQGIKKPGRALGVLPSSFNPPTKAHRILIEKARDLRPIDEVLLILDKRPLDKEIFGASLEERLLMILLCFQKDSAVSLAFTNRGRFVEKLELIMDAYPKDTLIRFIVGYDTMVRVLDAKYYENRNASLTRLFAGSEFLVATRGNARVDEIRRLALQRENRPFAEKIIPLEIPLPHRRLSSTQIRNAIRQRSEIDEFVPSQIKSYLERSRLYRN